MASSQNRHVLEGGGYRYHFHSNNRKLTIKYWRCVRRKACTARIATNFDVDEKVEIMSPNIPVHTHDPENFDHITF